MVGIEVIEKHRGGRKWAYNIDVSALGLDYVSMGGGYYETAEEAVRVAIEEKERIFADYWNERQLALF